MGCASVLEGLLHLLWDAAFHPEQDSSQQGSFRVGPQTVHGAQGALLVGIYRFQEGIALAGENQGRTGSIHQAIYPLPGQVIPVRKIFIFGRCL